MQLRAPLRSAWQRLRHPSTLPPFFFLALSAITAALVVNYFFCPRFVLWKGLSLPESWFNPELNRAIATLRQVEHPFEPVTQDTNRVIQWRLLFPLLAHYLALPRFVFLALPHLGCLLTLGWITRIAWTETRSRIAAICTAILFGTSSWFFVSMGWLAYFDSWYVLGLLLAAFHPSRRWLAACCLLVPWIDERFVLALPLCLVVRELYLPRGPATTGQRWKKDLIVIGATTLPWIALRVALVAMGKDTSPSASTWQAPFWEPGMAWTILCGWWMGLRALWVYPALYLLISYRRGMRGTVFLFVACVLVTLVLNLRLAGDLSRSVSNLLPLVLFAFVANVRTPTFPWRPLLYSLTAANLLLPASHVVTLFSSPIFYWRYEMTQSSDPPPEVNANKYNQRGAEAWQKGDQDTALNLFTAAIYIRPGFSEALVNRGIVYAAIGRPFAAETDFRRAAELAPTLYEAQFQLAQVLIQKGDSSEALSILRAILANSPAEYQGRTETERLLGELEGHR